MQREPLSLVVGMLVLAGLVVSGLANLWIEPSQDGALPGVALGSQTLLVVERAIAFFGAWLLVLVVLAQAFNGRLPIEVSGRGVRYADASQTQDGLTSTEMALRTFDEETKALKQDVARLSTTKMDY